MSWCPDFEFRGTQELYELKQPSGFQQMKAVVKRLLAEQGEGAARL